MKLNFLTLHSSVFFVNEQKCRSCFSSFKVFLDYAFFLQYFSFIEVKWSEMTCFVAVKALNTHNVLYLWLFLTCFIVIVRRQQFSCGCKLAVVFWSWQDSLCLLRWWVTNIFTCLLRLCWWVSGVNVWKKLKEKCNECQKVYCFIALLFIDLIWFVLINFCINSLRIVVLFWFNSIPLFLLMTSFIFLQLIFISGSYQRSYVVYIQMLQIVGQIDCVVSWKTRQLVTSSSTSCIEVWCLYNYHWTMHACCAWLHAGQLVVMSSLPQTTTFSASQMLWPCSS